MSPEPDNRSAAKKVIAAEASARARTTDPNVTHPVGPTSEVYRIMPPRPQPEPPTVEAQSSPPARQAHAVTPGIAVVAGADRQHKHRDLWVGLAAALIVGGPALAVTIWAAENSQTHVGFWPHTGEIGGLALMLLGVFLTVAVVRGWWLPGGFKEDKAPADEPRPGAGGAGMAPQRPSILPRLRELAVEGRSLQGSLTNRGKMSGMPPGLPDRVESWERTVSAALESKPKLRAQFEAPPGARFAILHSPTDDLYHRLEARLGVLEAIVQGLAGPGGEG
jgi:hypothetical protein